MQQNKTKKQNKPPHLCLVLSAGAFLPDTPKARGFMARSILSAALKWSNSIAPQYSLVHPPEAPMVRVLLHPQIPPL